MVVVEECGAPAHFFEQQLFVGGASGDIEGPAQTGRGGDVGKDHCAAGSVARHETGNAQRRRPKDSQRPQEFTP